VTGAGIPNDVMRWRH